MLYCGIREKKDFLFSVPANSDLVVDDTDKNYSDSESFRTSRPHRNLFLAVNISMLTSEKKIFVPNFPPWR